jgi:hypothetical protein
MVISLALIVIGTNVKTKMATSRPQGLATKNTNTVFADSAKRLWEARAANRAKGRGSGVRAFRVFGG